MEEKFKREINSFQNIWHGGYFGENSPNRNQIGLEDYLTNNIETDLTILEIGCGRGRWSKFIYENLHPKKLQCIDILSEKHNDFWRFVGDDKREKLEYYHVKDFSLNEIPDESLDFVFSYDVWCHISASSQELYLGDLKINREKFQISKGNENLILPKKEFELLALLATKPNKVFLRNEIFKQIWTGEIEEGNRTIDVHIRKLRSKLGDNYIKTIKGVGYKLNIE